MLHWRQSELDSSQNVALRQQPDEATGSGRTIDTTEEELAFGT